MARRGPWALLLVLAAVLAGCTAPDPGDPGNGLPRFYDVSQLLTTVSARQHADRTALLAVHGQVSGRSAGQATGRPELAVSGEGVVRIDATGVALRLNQTLDRPGVAARRTGLVVVGGQVFLHSPDGGDRPWLRAGSAVTPDDRLDAELAATLGDSADPTANLVRYADATLVADATDDTVGGTPAVRYTLVVDLGRAAVLQPDPVLRAQLEQQVRDGLTRITSRLWLDAAHRPVRTEQRQELPGIGTLTVTSDYHGWGTPVWIDAPPAAQVR